MTEQKTRWRVAELKTHFAIECERPCYHIEIHYGDHAHNIPNFGTKDQARADAECIAAALNARDGCTADPAADNSLTDPSGMGIPE